MRNIIIYTIAALIFSSPATFAEENTVRIGSTQNQIVGVLNVPDGVQFPPVVLLLHGFTGQKNEFRLPGSGQGLFSYTADKLANAGIASLRIDFTGSGESDGAWEDTTFSSQIDDAIAAFDYLKTLRSVNTGSIGILGYSQGGLVASHLAAQRPEAYAVVLWAPVTNPMSTYSIIMGAEKVNEGLKSTSNLPITAQLSWGGETKLKPGFFKQLPVTSSVGAIAKYRGPLQVIVGTQETIVTPQPAAAQVLLNYHDGLQKLVQLNSDHDWNGSKHTKTVENELVPATVNWFKRYAVEK